MAPVSRGGKDASAEKAAECDLLALNQLTGDKRTLNTRSKMARRWLGYGEFMT